MDKAARARDSVSLTRRRCFKRQLTFHRTIQTCCKPSTRRCSNSCRPGWPKRRPVGAAPTPPPAPSQSGPNTLHPPFGLAPPGPPTLAPTSGPLSLPPAPAPWVVGLGNPVGTRTAVPGGTSTAHDDIAREEGEHRRNTFRQWWGMKDRRPLWILAGASPLSFDATKNMFAVLSSMSDFDVLAFAPRGANPRDVTPIETLPAILCKFVFLQLSTCLPHDPA